MQINVNVVDYMMLELQIWDGLTAAIVGRVRISKLEVQKATKKQINNAILSIAQVARTKKERNGLERQV